MTKEFEDMLAQSASTDGHYLLSAKEAAKKRMLEEPTTANIAAFERASSMLERRSGAEPARFKNRLEALEYLQQQGYKIKKSKLYQDVKAGILRVNPDGTVSLSQIQKYLDDPRSGLMRLLTNASGALHPSETMEDLQREKLIYETNIQKEKLKKMEFDREREEGKHMPREELEMAFASRAAMFEAGLKHCISRHATKWATLIGGSTTRVDELIDQMHQDMDGMLDDLASIDRLTIEFVASEIDTPETATPLAMPIHPVHDSP
jgi:hypothetical protein